MLLFKGKIKKGKFILPQPIAVASQSLDHIESMHGGFFFLMNLGGSPKAILIEVNQSEVLVNI